ncbi:MAG TPA: 16S rRNA (guanine(966)-N(2))-methyltransferase RsmD [Polyangia bacterium]|jgi:16S rRNA (guanine(966)-N(2))-methyltransferase RsmD|nr:16S rRNA (guanine(966)-N(2))-methyltransferase RsmD [Polyangia bacterium]
MRLTGGLERGRRLKAPRGSTTRPTAAKVREAIFNILGPPPGGAVLDLFAGTGALGIEALSRGAERAVFVERDRNALQALRTNLREFGIEGRSTVIGADVRTALRRLAGSIGEDDRFSWVFMDPPYAEQTEAILAELSQNDVLAKCAVVVVEHDKRHRPPASIGGLFLTSRREYGDTELSFYRAGCS